MKRKTVRILLLDGAIALALPLLSPLANWMMAALPACLFAERGITCPSCGATRCVRALFGGDFGAAFFFHPFLFLLIFYLVLALLLANFGILLRRPRIEKAALAMVNPRAVLILCLLYLAFGLIRCVFLLF